jgi:hypothetical protein
MIELVMARERLSFRSSPDKGRNGGVGSDGIGFLHDLPPKSPFIPPLSGERRADKRFLPHLAASFKTDFALKPPALEGRRESRDSFLAAGVSTVAMGEGMHISPQIRLERFA